MREIVKENSLWVRYAFDTLVILLGWIDTTRSLVRVNNIYSEMKFTMEEEENMFIPSLDTLSIRRGVGITYSEMIHIQSRGNSDTHDGYNIIAGSRKNWRNTQD